MLNENKQIGSHGSVGIEKQRGVVLFFTLVALVVMSLAALALVRSVDTGSMIAGNLAFKQAATISADAGVEAAIRWLQNVDRANLGINYMNDPTHPFNKDDPANGYYSSFDPKMSLTGPSGINKYIHWDNVTKDNVLVGTDRAENEVRFIIQRLCKVANTMANAAGCLYSSDALRKDSMATKMPPEVCDSIDCPQPGQSVHYVITVRTVGPRGTESYIQNYVN